MASAAKQAPTAPAPTQADLDRIRFVKAAGKCSTLHLAEQDGKTGVCDRQWEMRPATEDEMVTLAGKLCKVCVARLAPKPVKPKATAKPKATVKVTTTTPSPRKAKTAQAEGAEGQRTQAQLKAERQQREQMAVAA